MAKLQGKTRESKSGLASFRAVGAMIRPVLVDGLGDGAALSVNLRCWSLRFDGKPRGNFVGRGKV